MIQSYIDSHQSTIQPEIPIDDQGPPIAVLQGPVQPDPEATVHEDQDPLTPWPAPLEGEPSGRPIVDHPIAGISPKSSR